MVHVAKKEGVHVSSVRTSAKLTPESSINCVCGVHSSPCMCPFQSLFEALVRSKMY